MKNQYTISVFTENQIGLLNRVSIIFTRRYINIETRLGEQDIQTSMLDYVEQHT